MAGVDEAKEAVAEVVDLLRDPSKYARMGARVPRGVLLVGPPGTGKTLLAKCVEMNQMSSEELIVHLLHDMHAPSPGGRTIEIPCPSVLDLPISLRKAMFNVSNLGRLPSTQLNFNFLFSKKMELETTETTEQKYLSFPNFMSVWTMLLLEKKIIVHSKYVWLVPTFLETLRTLMFPLTWENVYIPMVNNFCLIIFV